MLKQFGAKNSLDAKSEHIAKTNEKCRPHKAGKGIQEDEARNGDLRHARCKTTNCAHPVHVSVEEYERVWMPPDRRIGVGEARLLFEASHARMVCKAATDEEQCRIAQERARIDRCGSSGAPEYILMGEETRKNCNRFTFGKAPDKNGNQAIPLDQGMDDFAQLRPSLCSMRAMASVKSPICLCISTISRWRISSSFSCSAMISISAFRLTA